MVTAREVAANLYMIVLPIPVPFLESINIYVVVGSDRNLVIDTGFSDGECLSVVRSALRDLRVDPRDTDFFITHGHPDHFGLLGRLVSGQSRVYVGADEARQINRARTSAIMEDYAGFLSVTGFPETDPYKVFPPDTLEPYRMGRWRDFRLISEGDALEYGGHKFRCVATPGHTSGHMCLHDANTGLLVSGDHLLPDISPTIQLWQETGNPLESYRKSLAKVSEMDVSLVLPGHGPVFANCGERIAQLQQHHEERLGGIISSLSEAPCKDAYLVASSVSWNLSGCEHWNSAPLTQRFFATGEAFSHLRFLKESGVVSGRMDGTREVYCLTPGRHQRIASERLFR